MVYDCGSCLAKYLLCCFNFIIFLAGSIVLGVGAWLVLDKNSLITISKIIPDDHLEQFTQPHVVEQGAYILIAIGGFMFIVSFLGYCGALRESQCLLTLYGLCLILILILEVAAGGLAVAYKAKAEEETRNFLKGTIKRYYTDKTDAVTLMWDHLQAQLHCCGVDGYQDFEKLPKWNSTNKIVPESCCVLDDVKTFKPKSPFCTSAPNVTNSYADQGCYEALLEWLKGHMDIVMVVAITLGVLELLGVCFAFCLCKSVDHYGK